MIMHMLKSFWILLRIRRKKKKQKDKNLVFQKSRQEMQTFINLYWTK